MAVIRRNIRILVLLASSCGIAGPRSSCAAEEKATTKKPAATPLAAAPREGSWSRWHVTTKRKDLDQEFSHKLTICSVGRVTDGLKSSQWIELKIAEADEATTIVKLLLPEKEILDGANPAKELVRGWEKIGSDVLAIDANRAQLYAADLLVLPGPLQSAEELPEKTVVEYQKGRLEIPRGLRGRQEVEIRRGDGKATFKSRFAVWFHPEVKLGFAAARVTTTVDLNGTPLATTEREYRLEETGDNAKSELANYK